MAVRGNVRVAAVAAVAAVGVLLTTPALAHPLGLPAFARLAADGSTVTVLWNASPDDVAALATSLGLAPRGTAALSRRQDSELAASAELRVRVDRDVRVQQDGRPCEGGLAAPTSVVESGLRVVFRCPRDAQRVRVRIALLHDVDSRYRTLAAYDGARGSERVMFSSADPEHEITLDPSAVAPVQERRAPESGVSGAFGGALPLERRFVAAIDSTPGLLGAALALLVAFVVGALHALAPGHGKAAAAAYLIGDRARVRHAVVLGTTVALMHTGSVLALGLALFSATRAPDSARLSASIGLVTGITFAGLGLWLLTRRWRTRGAANHRHAHDEPHEAPAPLSLQGVVVLGAAGGLLPSPSALLVLLTALAVGRVAYGLTLIAVFSLGLATTVTLVGVAVLRGRDLLHDRAGARLHQLVHAAPLVGAVAVTLVGTAIALQATARLSS